MVLYYITALHTVLYSGGKRVFSCHGYSNSKWTHFRIAVAEGLLDGYEAAKARRHSQDPQLPLAQREVPS